MWPEKIIKDDGSEVYDSAPEFAELKAKFLAMDKTTKNWVLVAMNPNSSINAVKKELE